MEEFAHLGDRQDLESAARRRRRNRLLAAACVCVAAACLLASDGLLRGAALFSAGLELPQGAGSLLAAAPQATELSDVNATAASAALPGEPRENEKNFDIKATPKDIQLLMEEAVHEFAGQMRDGDILAKTYKAADGTHRWGRLSARNTTATQPGRDLSKDLAAPLGLRIDKSKPAVLIFHAHTTEAFEILERPWYAVGRSARTEHGAKNIARVGGAMAQMLERAGFEVIHDDTIYDRQYTGAYDKSRAAVLRWLEKYPSIQVTLDVHRDAIHQNDGVYIKPVADINGKKAAQVMIIAGCEEGSVTDFPNWAQNLSFAAKLHVAAEELYPGLMRPIFFAPRKYNMDVTPFSLLLEMGSDVNTLEEAVYSGRLMGDALARLLEQYTMNNEQ